MSVLAKANASLSPLIILPLPPTCCPLPSSILVLLLPPGNSLAVQLLELYLVSGDMDVAQPKAKKDLSNLFPGCLSHCVLCACSLHVPSHII